jgi:protein-tyrosine phosphatase
MSFRRIDVHSHLLPGVDDGCPTLEESIECARMLVGAGYSHCFCTPHVWPSLPHQSRQTLPQWTADLQSALETAGVPLSLLPGGELNLGPATMTLPPDRIISLALADRYILVDMWADKLPDWFVPTILWLQKRNLTVILAHPERMRAVQDQPQLSEQLTDMGVLLQGNLQCFADRPDSFTRRTAELFLTGGRYFVLGTDCHNIKGLEHRLVGLKNAIAAAGEEVVDRLTRENPRQLIPQ